MTPSDLHLRVTSSLQSSALLGKRHAHSLAVPLLIAALLLFVAYIARLNDVLHDIFHAMALAREAINSGHFPQNDPFAFSPTMAPTVHHEWGFGMLAYIVTANPWGDALLMSSRFLLIAVMFTCLYRVCRARGGDPMFFALGLMIVLPFFWVGFSTVRAQLLTLVFLSIQLLMIEADWRGGRLWIIAWLLMMLAWLNIHAGFVVGAAMMGLHGIERCLDVWIKTRTLLGVWQRTWHLVVAAPLAGLLLLVNPYGVEYISYLAHGLTMPRPLIGEWWPLWTILNPQQTLFCFAVTLGIVAYCIRYRQWSRLRGLAFTLFCAIMAYKHVRHGSIYALIWLAYAPAWLSITPLGERIRGSLLRNQKQVARFALITSLASLAFTLWFSGWRPYLPVNAAGQRGDYPLGAISYLETHHISGRFITDFDSGAYVTWRLYPQVLVSLDGRYEAAFQPGVLEEHLDFFNGLPNSGEILDRWGAGGILIPAGTKLYQQLHAQNSSTTELEISGSRRRWKCVYNDPGTSIWMPSTCSVPVEHDQHLPPPGRYPR